MRRGEEGNPGQVAKIGKIGVDLQVAGKDTFEGGG